MDTNGTRFHLLLGRDDWGACLQNGQRLAELWDEGSSFAWDGARAELTLRPELFHFSTSPRNVAPSIENRRGAARDRYGNFFWIDRDELTLRVRSRETQVTSTFWPVASASPGPSTDGTFGPAQPSLPAAPMTLRGLAITSHHYLIAGTLAPAGVLVFDLHAGGPPHHLAWPTGVAFAPFDLAALPRGGVLILDRSHRRLWQLDSRLQVARFEPSVPAGAEDIFQPDNPSSPRRRAEAPFPTGLSLDAFSPAPSDPIAVEALEDGRVLVLDRGTQESQLWVYRDGALEGPPIPLSVGPILDPEGPHADYRLIAHDFALSLEQGEETWGRLSVASGEGDQAFIFQLSESQGHLRATPLTEYMPMRLFGGRGLVAVGEQVFYDFADGFIPLVAQRRPRYVNEATLLTPVLDGREPGCVWHRLLLDAFIPPGASVTVRSRAANEREELEAQPFSPEPDLLQRAAGSELPYVSRSRGTSRGTFELLFQGARGRYAQLELTLRGGGNVSPRLRALRAWYPRFSYAAQYLPAIYREDRESAGFLERFLANLEGILTPIEDRIAAAQVLLDARSAPTEALDWLAGWFGVALDPAWDEARRRLFIRHAVDFFRHRGTPRGIRMALRLALDTCPDESLFSEETSAYSAIRILEKPPVAQVAPRVRALEEGARSGLQVGTAGAHWQPSQGLTLLLARYHQALGEAGLGPGPDQFPTRQPSAAAVATVWRTFCLEVLGFIPAATDADTAQWRQFLARRYRRIEALNAAHRTSLPRFEAVALPLVLSANEAALTDWYQFESVVLAARAAAHRFSVILPVPQGRDTGVQRARLEQALRVVELEKPAHTLFDVKFYWGLFRVGEARLGMDTLIDLGSRAPELTAAMELGRTSLAEGFLTPRPPQDATDRQILGRDLLQAPANQRSGTP